MPERIIQQSMSAALFHGEQIQPMGSMVSPGSGRKRT
jgi:hypothetical protein